MTAASKLRAQTSSQQSDQTQTRRTSDASTGIKRVCYKCWSDAGSEQNVSKIKSTRWTATPLLYNITQWAHHWLLLRQWCSLNQLVSILGVQR